MEKIGCPLCGADDALVVATVADYVVASQNVICRGCGLVYTNPRLSAEEREAYYRTSFIQGRHQIKSVDEARERARRKGSQKKYRVDVFSAGLTDRSRALEIGCSYGFLLNALRTATGCRVEGVEPSEVSGAFAREEFDIPVFKGTVEEYLASSPKGPFDLIIVYHVLEHLADPVGVLRRLRALLAPGGKLYIVVPDVTHLQEPPESFFQVPHLISFSPWTLRRALADAGFTIILFRRKLRPPKNGMEAIAVPVTDRRDALMSDELLIGKDPDAVARSLDRVRFFYGALRRVKRLVRFFLPASTLDRIAVATGRTVRSMRDRP